MTSIAFHRVTKWYPRYHHVMKGLKHSLLHPVDTIRGFRAEGFLALDNVSFEIARGEAVGFIGANGSGKSTTLGLMAGVLAPHTGEVIAQGRVAPLLELGSGFHFDLTGRETFSSTGFCWDSRDGRCRSGLKISFVSANWRSFSINRSGPTRPGWLHAWRFRSPRTWIRTFC